MSEMISYFVPWTQLNDLTNFAMDDEMIMYLLFQHYIHF